MKNIQLLKELLDKMNKANSTYSNERHIGGTLLEDFSRAENRLCEAVIAMLPALIAVAEAAGRIGLYDYSGNDSDFVYDCDEVINRLAELEGVKIS